MKEISFWATLAMHGKDFPKQVRKGLDETVVRREIKKLDEFEKKVASLLKRADELKNMHRQRIDNDDDGSASQ
eukprot:7554971-Pyramimonas_sp.AAC.1